MYIVYFVSIYCQRRTSAAERAAFRVCGGMAERINGPSPPSGDETKVDCQPCGSSKQQKHADVPCCDARNAHLPTDVVDAGRQLHTLVLSNRKDESLELLQSVPHAASVWLGGSLPLHTALTGPSVALSAALLTAHPAAAGLTDDEGMLPLHIACMYGAPLQVVEALLTAWPAAATMVGGGGWPPLLMALKARADVAVCRALLGADSTAARYGSAPCGPDGEQRGMLPLHAAVAADLPDEFVRELLAACPEAAAIGNQKGLLPLHVALESHRDEDTLDALLNAFPDAASTLVCPPRAAPHALWCGDAHDGRFVSCYREVMGGPRCTQLCFTTLPTRF